MNEINESITLDDIYKYISELSILELEELITEYEEKYMNYKKPNKPTDHQNKPDNKYLNKPLYRKIEYKGKQWKRL